MSQFPKSLPSSRCSVQQVDLHYCLPWEATQRNALPGLHWSLRECSQLLLEAGILCTACWKEEFLNILLKNITKMIITTSSFICYSDCFLLSSFLLPSYLHNTVSPKQVKGFPMGQKDLSRGLWNAAQKRDRSRKGGEDEKWRQVLGLRTAKVSAPRSRPGTAPGDQCTHSPPCCPPAWVTLTISKFFLLSALISLAD